MSRSVVSVRLKYPGWRDGCALWLVSRGKVFAWFGASIALAYLANLNVHVQQPPLPTMT